MYGGKKDVGRIIVYEVELTIENRSSAIVDILDVDGARGTTQFASTENARNLDCAQVSDSVRFWAMDGRIEAKRRGSTRALVLPQSPEAFEPLCIAFSIIENRRTTSVRKLVTLLREL